MEVTVINAFVGKGLKGNPAGVACVDSFPEDDDMQRVAKEMELSETCFVCQGDNGSYNLRWFSPTAEVDLCGHATLAAAHYMWSEGVVSESEEINFYTRSGILKAKSEDGFIWLDFPAEVAHEVSDKELIETIAGALCIDVGQIKFVGQNRMDYLIEVGSVEEVSALKPNMEKLKEIETRGFIVTSSGSEKNDFVSRFFAPSYGIAEDPVTGSAHTALAPYWASKLNKTEMVGCQLSERGGVVKVKLAGDRVFLGGVAETVKVVAVEV